MSFSLTTRALAMRSTRSIARTQVRFYADKPIIIEGSKDTMETAGETVKKAGQAFKSDGAIGKQFNSDGNIGQVGQAVGGPFAADGAVGKNFTEDGSVGGSVQSGAKEVEETGKEHKRQAPKE